MDKKAKAELYDIIRQLNNVAQSLDQQANALNSTKGVGAEICAQKLRDAAGKYRKARRALENL